MTIPGFPGVEILHPLWLLLLPLVPLMAMLRGVRGKRAAIKFPRPHCCVIWAGRRATASAALSLDSF